VAEMLAKAVIQLRSSLGTGPRCGTYLGKKGKKNVKKTDKNEGKKDKKEAINLVTAALL